MHLNTPGIRRKIDIEKELYFDFQVRYGITPPEKTNLLFSKEAEFKRNQIRDYVRTGKDLPGFAVDYQREYGEQVMRNFNQRRARQNHAARFN